MHQTVATDEKEKASDKAGAQLRSRRPQFLDEAPGNHERACDQMAGAGGVEGRNCLDRVADRKKRGTPDEPNGSAGEQDANAIRRGLRSETRGPRRLWPPRTRIIEGELGRL